MVNTCRRTTLGLAIAWMASGCAAPGEVEQVPPKPVGTALLTPWLVIHGGWRGEPIGAPAPGLLPARPLRPSPVERLNFQVPVALSVRDDVVLIADTGLRQLMRLDRARDALTPLAALPFDNQLALHAAPDGSCWVAEPASGLVRQFARDGRVVRTLKDDRLAGRPVAVVAPVEAGGDVFVADAALASVVVFNTFGRAVRRIGHGELQSIASMALGPLGLYVVDRAAQQVVVYGRDGRRLLSLGEESLVMPRAVAVDAYGRIFVADESGNAILVFIDGELASRYVGTGTARAMRIDALAVDGNLLYLADSVAARVQILLITPESLRRPPKS